MELPSSWSARPVDPGSPFRVAAFGLPRAADDERDAEFVLTRFPGGVGSVDANLARWRGLFEPDPLAGGKVPEEVRSFERDGLGITILDLRGTFVGATDMNQPDECRRWPGHRAIYVLVEAPGIVWSLRATGSQATLALRAAEVEAVVDSLHREAAGSTRMR